MSAKQLQTLYFLLIAAFFATEGVLVYFFRFDAVAYQLSAAVILTGVAFLWDVCGTIAKDVVASRRAD